MSLHAADDELRSELVPVNRLWPLAELQDAVDDWRARTHRRPSIEWAMIRSANDADDQAERLAPIALRLHAHVNLIPLNPTGLAPELARADRGVRRDPRRRGRDGDRPRHARARDRRRLRPLSLEHAARAGTA